MRILEELALRKILSRCHRVGHNHTKFVYMEVLVDDAFAKPDIEVYIEGPHVIFVACGFVCVRSCLVDLDCKQLVPLGIGCACPSVS